MERRAIEAISDEAAINVRDIVESGETTYPTEGETINTRLRNIIRAACIEARADLLAAAKAVLEDDAKFELEPGRRAALEVAVERCEKEGK